MLRFIHISDTHIGDSREYERYGRKTYAYTRHLVNYINNDLGFEPDFVVHTGDVLDFPEEACASLAAEALSDLKYPIYYVVGNHDGRGLLRQYFLNQPPIEDHLFYDFHQKGVHFIVLDTRSEIDPQGYITEEQLEWLAHTCAATPDESLCLLIHHLPFKMGVVWYDREMRIMNADAFFEVLKPHRERLRGVFFGHIHRALTGYRDGIMCSATASAFMQFRTVPTDEHSVFDAAALPGYSIVTLTDHLTTVTHHNLPFAE